MESIENVVGMILGIIILMTQSVLFLSFTLNVMVDDILWKQQYEKENAK